MAANGGFYPYPRHPNRPGDIFQVLNHDHGEAVPPPSLISTHAISRMANGSGPHLPENSTTTAST